MQSALIIEQESESNLPESMTAQEVEFLVATKSLTEWQLEQAFYAAKAITK